MRRVRRIVALACVSGALLVGTVAPAQAGPPWSSSNPLHAGVWLDLQWCEYYGASLTSGPDFDYWNCAFDGYAYHLYVW
jgi:hypothetical protein